MKICGIRGERIFIIFRRRRGVELLQQKNQESGAKPTKMNTTLHFRFLILFSLFSICAQAQKVRMGFLAGPAFSLAAYEFPTGKELNNPDVPNEVKSWQSTPGFGSGIGLEAEYDFTDKIFVSTGLTLNTSSFKTTVTDEYIVEKLTIEQQYQFSIFGIQVPVLLHYRVGKFNAGIGGFGALAISGQLKYKRLENQSVENTYDQALVFNSDKMEYADFRPFNAGLRAELGYGIKRLRVSTFFDAGLLNSSPKTASGDVEFQQYPLRRSTLGFSLLYQHWPR